jgi:hypothetical protein
MVLARYAGNRGTSPCSQCCVGRGVRETVNLARSFAVQRNGAINRGMKKAAFLAALIALFLASGMPAQADNCSAVADQYAAQYGAEVLSVKEQGGNCVIKLRIPGQGGQPPRVETISVPG